MNTLHFKYALEVEKTGSITQAADNLYMGQPSLSKAIKELEDTLQIEIFKRSPRGMVPTEEGAQFLQYARNILVQLDNMEQIAEEKNGERKSLRIGLASSEYLMQAAFAFSKLIFQKQPINLEFPELNSRAAIQFISEGKCNFAILRIPQDSLSYYQYYCGSRGLKMETIWGFEEQAALSAETGFSPKQILSLEDLSPLTEIRFQNNSFLGRGLDASDGSASSLLKRENGRSLALSGYAQALAFLSQNPDAYFKSEPLSAEVTEAHHLMLFSLKDAQKYQDVLLYPEGYRFCKTEHLFIDCVYQQKNRIVL